MKFYLQNSNTLNSVKLIVLSTEYHNLLQCQYVVNQKAPKLESIPIIRLNPKTQFQTICVKWQDGRHMLLRWLVLA